jgi:hypothetical protein
MVATYSLLWGTGDKVTVAVCTGIPCIPAPAGGAAAFFSQPAAAKQTATIKMNPILRLNALILTESLFRTRWSCLEFPPESGVIPNTDFQAVPFAATPSFCENACKADRSRWKR